MTARVRKAVRKDVFKRPECSYILLLISSSYYLRLDAFPYGAADSSAIKHAGRRTFIGIHSKRVRGIGLLIYNRREIWSAAKI